MRSRRPLAITPSLAESGEKRSESNDVARATIRWLPPATACSSTCSASVSVRGTVMYATHLPSGEIAGARPTPSRWGFLPLSSET